MATGSRCTAGCRPLAAASRDHAAAFDPTTRVPTGTPGLDAVVNGGYFLGSTTVVSGISGVGKSVMGLQYIAEGARRGERSLMLTLDEQVPQVIRNANSIGIDLQPHIDSGLVRLQYDAPQEMEIDVHFHNIEQLVEELKPKRVLIDSLSTYGANMGTGGRVFRDFFHALVALMKEHQTVGGLQPREPGDAGDVVDDGRFRHELARRQHPAHELDRAGGCLPARADRGENAREPEYPLDPRVRDSGRSGPARAAAPDSGPEGRTRSPAIRT